ncbi:MAG TPA: hypothetical protein VFU02_22280 [Polyangiaceae bacterium]|nr:hypothetical protein [Polyangiaceae bacterium]
MSSPDTETDSDELDPDEPRTPMWLPLLGGGLFLLALFLFLATRTDAEPIAENSGDAAAEQAPDTDEKAPTDPAAARAPDAPAPGDPAAAQGDRAAARAARAAAQGDPAPAQGDRAAAQGDPAPARGDTRNRAPDDPHFGHDHD